MFVYSVVFGEEKKFRIDKNTQDKDRKVKREEKKNN